MRALEEPLEVPTKARFSVGSSLNEQELSPEAPAMAQGRPNLTIKFGHRFGSTENSFVSPTPLNGFRRVDDKGDYFSPTISLCSDFSPSVSCPSISKATRKCHICSKPPTTAFSSPLKRCLQCKRSFHLECHNPPIPIETQQQGHLSAAWQCSRCSKRSRRNIMATTGSDAATRWPNNSRSHDSYGLQNFEWPSKRQKSESKLPIADQSTTRLPDLSANNTKQSSPFVPLRPRWSSGQREITNSCESVVRPTLASNITTCPDAPIVSGVAQRSHDGTNIDIVLMDRLSDLAADDARLTYLLEGMAGGTLSQAEMEEYTAYCTALAAEVSWSVDSWHARFSTGIITPQSMPETGVAAPKQINQPYQPQLISTALYDRLSKETSSPSNPVEVPKTDFNGTGIFPVSDRTIIQSVEEPVVKIYHQYEETCQKCFRDIPMAQKQIGGTSFCAGCEKLITHVKPQSFKATNVVKTNERRDRTNREYLVSPQLVLTAGSRTRPRTPERRLAAEAMIDKDNSPLFFSSPPHQVSFKTAMPNMLPFEPSSLARKKFRGGKALSTMNDSGLDEPNPTSIPAKDVLRYKERVKGLQEGMKDKDATIVKLNKELRKLRRVEYDAGKLEKEVSQARKDQYATEIELRKLKSQLLSVREQLLVRANSPPPMHGLGTAPAKGTSTIKSTGQQDVKDDVELQNLRDQVDVLQRALACRDNPFPDLQFGHKKLLTAPLVLRQSRKTLPQEKSIRERVRPPRNIAALTVVQGASLNESIVSGSEYHQSSVGDAGNTKSVYSGAQDEDDDDGEEEDATFKTRNERALAKFDRMVGIPRNPIACRADGMLAFREGVRDTRGRLPRTKNVFKVGRDVPGQLR